MTKLIFGCGYLGDRVARLWQAAGHEVFVVTRSAERARKFVAEGLRPIVADILNPDTLARLPAAETVLFAVGFDRAAGGSIFDVYVAGLRDVLASLADGTRRFIYISSTGVYGPAQGDVVDEETPPNPQREGGQACLAAERTLMQDRLGEQAIILRLAGIYGPGRIPLASAIRAGEPIPAPASGWLNLIHADDAARIVLAAEREAEPPRVFNVSDGQPAVRREYYAELARLLNAPAPKFVTPDSNSPAAARARADKQINNARLLSELSIQLAYPSYREGLRAILGDEKSDPERLRESAEPGPAIE